MKNRLIDLLDAIGELLDYIFIRGLLMGDWTRYPDPWNEWAKDWPELAHLKRELRRRSKHP